MPKEVILVFGAVRSTPNEKKANVRIKIANARIELKVWSVPKNMGRSKCNVAKKICSVAQINAHKRG